MNIAKIDAGACKQAQGYTGATRKASNAAIAVSNAFKRSAGGGRPVLGGLSRDRLALVHVAKRDLQLEDDLYRALLQDVAGVTSSKALTETGFRAVMARFERLGFQPKDPPAAAKHADLGERLGMATPKQLAYIRGLWAEWLGREDDTALSCWIEKRYHVSAIRFLDVTAAQKAIEGLKRMTDRKHYDECIGAMERAKSDGQDSEQAGGGHGNT